MRTALCLYGQPRNFSANWHFINENIVKPNNADVFFHCWYDLENTHMNKMTPGHEHRHLEKQLDKTLIDVINPKNFKIEKQKNFFAKEIPVTEENIEACWPWSRSYDKKQFINDRVRAHYSMWYSINQSVQAKEIYAQENNFEYDCVILSRFDVSPKEHLIVNNFDLSRVITPNLNHPREEVCDWFLFSNSINANIIGSIFYSIDLHRNKIIQSNGIWTNEAYLRDQLKVFSIEVEKSSKFEVSF